MLDLRAAEGCARGGRLRLPVMSAQALPQSWAEPEQMKMQQKSRSNTHLARTCEPTSRAGSGGTRAPCAGAVKAGDSASLAMKGDGQHFGPLDACIEDHRQTDLDRTSATTRKPPLRLASIRGVLKPPASP